MSETAVAESASQGLAPDRTSTCSRSRSGAFTSSRSSASRSSACRGPASRCALALYLPRMWFVTGAYHRYFSHRSYKTSRWFQFVLALGATIDRAEGPAVVGRASPRASQAQRSARRPALGDAIRLLVVAHGLDPVARSRGAPTTARIKDFSKYPELRWLDKYWMIPPIAVGVITFLLGGFFALVWGFAVAQVLCWHGTFTINSLSHIWGGRRYETDDDSRNNPVLAVITLGEGWHNNHHHYQVQRAQRLLLVGVRRHVLRPEGAVVRRPRVGPPRRARARAATTCRSRCRRRRTGACPTSRSRAVSARQHPAAPSSARADARGARADDPDDGRRHPLARARRRRPRTVVSPACSC